MEASNEAFHRWTEQLWHKSARVVTMSSRQPTNNATCFVVVAPLTKMLWSCYCFCYCRDDQVYLPCRHCGNYSVWTYWIIFFIVSFDIQFRGDLLCCNKIQHVLCWLISSQACQLLMKMLCSEHNIILIMKCCLIQLLHGNNKCCGCAQNDDKWRIWSVCMKKLQPTSSC